MHSLHSFIEEIERQRDICHRNQSTTAIHTKGKELQVYRMHKADKTVIEHLRDAASSLPSWDSALLSDWEGSKWNKVKSQIDSRVKRHEKQQSVLSQGVSWKGSPILIHSYKFEPDSSFKVELVMLSTMARQPERSLKTISEALECHDFLIPEHVAKPKPPYSKHETDFQTIDEYLSRKLPSDLYNLYCFPPAANGYSP